MNSEEKGPKHNDHHFCVETRQMTSDEEEDTAKVLGRWKCNLQPFSWLDSLCGISCKSMHRAVIEVLTISQGLEAPRSSRGL